MYCIGRYRDSRQTQIYGQVCCGFLRRAGVKPWERLFHNLRASRQTELCNEFPSHVVADWLGNTPDVADKHYLLVTEQHFQQAINDGLQMAAQGGATGGAQGDKKGGADGGAAHARSGETSEAKSVSGQRDSAKKCGISGYLHGNLSTPGQDSNL